MQLTDCNNLSWARLTPGTRNSILVSPLGGGYPTTPEPSDSQVTHQQDTGSDADTGLELKHSDMGCGQPE